MTRPGPAQSDRPAGWNATSAGRGSRGPSSPSREDVGVTRPVARVRCRRGAGTAAGGAAAVPRGLGGPTSRARPRRHVSGRRSPRGARPRAGRRPEWPVGLDRLKAPPYCLFVRGDTDLAALVERSVAIVGSRAATDYGLRVAADLGDGPGGTWLHRRQRRRVRRRRGRAPGRPRGRRAHRRRAGLRRRPRLPHGTPRAARPGRRGRGPWSARCRWGALRTGPASWPATGSSPCWRRATVVVEANRRSGSLTTAKAAREHHLPVGAVPGPVTSMTSAGCHTLVRDTGAVLVTDAAEVAELAARIGEDLLPAGHGRARIRASPGTTSTPRPTRSGRRCRCTAAPPSTGSPRPRAGWRRDGWSASSPCSRPTGWSSRMQATGARQRPRPDEVRELTSRCVVALGAREVTRCARDCRPFRRAACVRTPPALRTGPIRAHGACLRAGRERVPRRGGGQSMTTRRCAPSPWPTCGPGSACSPVAAPRARRSRAPPPRCAPSSAGSSAPVGSRPTRRCG